LHQSFLKKIKQLYATTFSLYLSFSLFLTHTLSFSLSSVYFFLSLPLSHTLSPSFSLPLSSSLSLTLSLFLNPLSSLSIFLSLQLMHKQTFFGGHLQTKRKKTDDKDCQITIQLLIERGRRKRSLKDNKSFRQKQKKKHFLKFFLDFETKAD